MTKRTLVVLGILFVISFTFLNFLLLHEEESQILFRPEFEDQFKNDSKINVIGKRVVYILECHHYIILFISTLCHH